jgi:phage gp36-like protein
MPDYVTMADITGMIPGPFLVEGLDDDGDGQADPAVWTQVAADVRQAIDGVLGARFEVPFANPLPAVVVNAAKIFAAEQIYTRRGRTDANGKLINPFTKQADAIRKQLATIASGDEPLDPSKARAKASVSVITEPARTTSKKLAH